MKSFGQWPVYSHACRKDVDTLLKKGGSLSAYRASSAFPDWKGPAKDSYAWRLEREIEKRFRVAHAVAVNSGTAALHAALAGLNLNGGEVITTPYSFSATASAIVLAGGIPTFADIDPYSYCLDAKAVKRAITRRTKAILPVHLFGQITPGLSDLCELGIPVVEDACQSVGARVGSKYSGTIGISGAYSYNGGKQQPAGEGGALVTNSSQVAEEARLLMNHRENFPHQKQVGYNYRINEVTACIAWHGLMELEERNGKRRALAMELNLSFWAAGEDLFTRPAVDDSHAFYTYPVLLKHGVNRSRFISRMKRKGYAVQAGYTQPLHTLPAFRKYQHGPLPVVEDVHKRLCLLNNVRPPSTEKQMREMAIAMREALE